MSASAAAPVATAAPTATAALPTPASVGSAMPRSTGVINVVPTPVEGMEAKPQGSATKGMFERLNKKAQDTEAATAAAIKPPEAQVAKAADQKPDAAVDEKTAGLTAKPEFDEKGKPKVNPWKLSEEYKAKSSKLEAEVAELRKSGLDPAVRKSELEKYATIEKRAKELEDHIRFVDYSKSQEFTEKYQQPYEKAWNRAMGELKEIVISDPNSGEERPVAPQDLLKLVNLPLNQARELADQLYGASSNDIMLHRKEIKQLFEAKATALEEARTSGAERMKQQSALFQEKAQTIQKTIADNWEKANQSVVSDEKVAYLFKASDGDDEGKSRLEKGYKFVDEAFKMNPLNPNLTEEQRVDVVKRQAAARNRAAAFGHARLLLERERAAHEATKKELAEFRGTTPELESGKSQAAAPAASNGMAGMMQRLQSRAKPG